MLGSRKKLSAGKMTENGGKSQLSHTLFGGFVRFAVETAKG